MALRKATAEEAQESHVSQLMSEFAGGCKHVTSYIYRVFLATWAVY